MSTPKTENPVQGKGILSGSRLKLLIAVIVLTAAVSYLVFSSVQSSSAYYMTISELQTGGPSLENKKVRVAGTLVDNSVEWNARQLQLDFEIADDSGQLPVSYKGARPDMFQDGAQTIVEGKYVNGVFQASNLLLKCPSKYEAATPDPAAGTTE